MDVNQRGTDPAKPEAGSNVSSTGKPENEILTKFAELSAKFDRAEAETKQLRTENLKLQQDLSENTRFTGAVLAKLENNKSVPQSGFLDDSTEEDVLAKLQEKPKETIAKLVRSIIAQEAPKYVEQGAADSKKLFSDLHGTKLEMAKMALKSKYEGVDDDWDKLVKYGDEYPGLTAKVTDPKHLEAFYLMFKSLNNETPKRKNDKIDLDAFLKEKFAAGLDLGVAEPNRTSPLTEQEKRVAVRYKLSDEDYRVFGDRDMDLEQFKAWKERKKNG